MLLRHPPARLPSAEGRNQFGDSLLTKNLVAVAAASGQAIDIISAVGQCIEFLEVRGVRAVNVWGKQKAAAARLIEV